MLIVGRIPPPIGGVTIHVKRLIDYLEKNDIRYKYLSLEKKHILGLCKHIYAEKKVHLHSSSPLVRFLLSCLCLILRKYLIITYHGNLNRFGFWKNLCDKVSIRLCSIPVVINDSSFKVAEKLNSNARILSAYIPPATDEKALPISIERRLSDFKERHKYIFSTCAYSRAFDTDGEELYGIEQQVTIFRKYKGCGLVISDPSGDYMRFFEESGGTDSNILLLSEPHSFVAVVKEVDAVIRATTTDGDSLSIREALDVGVSVFATDCVSRPAGTILFSAKDRSELDQILADSLQDEVFRDMRRISQPNGAMQLVALYRELDLMKLEKLSQ